MVSMNISNTENAIESIEWKSSCGSRHRDCVCSNKFRFFDRIDHLSGILMIKLCKWILKRAGANKTV